MADKQRFSVFADFILRQFGSLKPAATSLRVFDVAGGMGQLNVELTARGVDTTTFDRRHKHHPVHYVTAPLTNDTPCECDVVVGMHPDGATRIIIAYAAHHHIPFAVVPCCADNGMSYRPWVRHLAELGRQLGFRVSEQDLDMSGRARVIFGWPSDS